MTSVRVLRVGLLALCLSCGVSPRVIVREQMTQRDLAQAAGTKDKVCRAGVAPGQPDPCVHLLSCIEGAQRTVHTCQDALEDLAQADDEVTQPSSCLAQGAANRMLCAGAGVFVVPRRPRAGSPAPTLERGR